jgi:hypothetical protein
VQQVQLLVDGAGVAGFAPDPTLGDLPTASLPPAFAANLRGKHTFTVAAAGELAPDAPLPSDTAAIDAAKLLDVFLYVEYRLA